MTRRIAINEEAPVVGAAQPQRRQNTRWRRVRGLKGALFAAPFFLGFAFTFIVPFVYAIAQSLFTQKFSGLGLGGGETVFVGLDNFTRGFTDDKFWAAMLRVIIFAVIEIPIMLVVASAMALLLDAVSRKMSTVFRLLLLIPFMVPAIVGAMVWIYLYSPTVGPLTELFGALGLDVNFFASNMVWFSIGNLLLWSAAGFNMLIIFGSLQSVPREVFDAARVDGASELRIAWSIKVPYIRGSLVLTTMLSIIGMLQLFNEPLLFRSVSPQTVTKDFTPILMIYNQAFDSSNYNYAAALSVILAVVVGVASLVFYRLTNRPQS